MVVFPLFEDCCESEDNLSYKERSCLKMKLKARCGGCTLINPELGCWKQDQEFKASRATSNSISKTNEQTIEQGTDEPVENLASTQEVLDSGPSPDILALRR